MCDEAVLMNRDDATGVQVVPSGGKGGAEAKQEGEGTEGDHAEDTKVPTIKEEDDDDISNNMGPE